MVDEPVNSFLGNKHGEFLLANAVRRQLGFLDRVVIDVINVRMINVIFLPTFHVSNKANSTKFSVAFVKHSCTVLLKHWYAFYSRLQLDETC